MSQSNLQNPSSPEQFWAIVPAAGVGTRMQADRPKQYLELLGKTLIEHSVQRLLDVPEITGVVIALDKQDTVWQQLQFTHTKPVLTVAGGAERCHSVLNALQFLSTQLSSPSPLMGEGWGDGVLACEDDTQKNCAQHTKTPSPLMGDDCMDAGGRATQGAVAEGWGDGVLACEDDTQKNCAQHTKTPSPLMGRAERGGRSRWGDGDVWVLVHDAARPCVRAEDLTKLIKEGSLDDHGGLLALPVRDTMKRQTTDGRVDTTVDRNGLWHAMTPQMFKLPLLIKALNNALEKKLHVTDDASAMELAGYHPRLVACHEDNIKITRPFDLTLATLYMQQQTLQQKTASKS